MPLKAALGSFLAEFHRFETEGVRNALQSLSRDAQFAERAEELLGLEARLTLVERLASARVMASELSASLLDLLSRARRLLDVREEIVQVSPILPAGDPGTTPLIVRRRSRSTPGHPDEPEELWVPAARELQAFASETMELNASLCAMAAEIGRA